MIDFKAFEAGIRIAPSTSIGASDPITGKVGEIYWNTTKGMLRICISSAPVWQDLFIQRGVINDSTLRWDTTNDRWTQNDSLRINQNLIYTANSATPLALELTAGDNSTALATGAGILINAGAGGAGGVSGSVSLSGDRIRINAIHSSDPVTGLIGDLYYNNTNNVFKYYDGSQYKTFDGSEITNSDRNCALVGGGSINWIESSNTLSWSGSAYMQVPGCAESRNEIASGSVVLASDGDVAYIDINRNAGAPSVLAVTVINISALGVLSPTNENRVVIARRHSGGVFWGLDAGSRIGSSNSSIMTSFPLLDNTSGGLVFSKVAAENDAIILKYSIKRDTSIEVGHLYITNDGVNAGVSGASNELGSVGVTFTVNINATNIELKYNTTNTGFDAVFRYSIEGWDAP